MKPKSNLTALPELFGNMMPVEVPEMDPNDGIIKGYFTKKKIGQLSEVQRMKAEIAEFDERAVKANSNKLMMALMFGRDYELMVAKNEADKAEAESKKLRAEAERETLKLNHIEHQAKINGDLLKNEEQSIKNDILKIERRELFAVSNLKLKDMGISDDWTYENRDR